MIKILFHSHRVLVQLKNFEPDINGGYRRINGFDEFDANQIGGSSGTVLGVHIYKDQVIAAKEHLYLKAQAVDTLALTVDERVQGDTTL